MTILSRFRIHGHSMEPVLKQNAEILVSSLPYFFSSPKLNDIVALENPKNGTILIKRITKIKNENYFVEGDNKHDSTDSRNFGMIGRDKIIGKVIYY